MKNETICILRKLTFLMISDIMTIISIRHVIIGTIITIFSQA